jgi:hypothetical protein
MNKLELTIVIIVSIVLATVSMIVPPVYCAYALTIAACVSTLAIAVSPYFLDKN